MAYTKSITFDYNANGGAGAPASSTSNYTFGSFPYTAVKQIASGKPSRTYYSFLGWATSSVATSASYASGQNVSLTWNYSYESDKVMHFYAVWKINTAYVYYNANGGSNAPSTQTHNAGTNITLSATKPTRSGYIFKGWATSATATVKQYDAGQANVPLYTTTTLYAVWATAASTISASNGTLGSAMTLTISRTDNTFTDTITYQFGTASGTVVSGTSAASVSWTPPTTLASEIPNSASGTVVFTCKTYNGGNLVGQTTKSVTLSVPQSLAPVVSVTYADTNATADAWGVFVQSRSKIAFTITATAQESATVTSYATSVNGTSYTTDSFTTDELINSGTNTYTVVVTDSRGLQTTVTGTYSVEPYGNPSLTLISCDRDDNDDSQINVEFNFTVSPVSNNNDANYALDYKLRSSNVWTQGTVQALGGYSGTITDIIPNLDGGDEWDIRIRVIDSFSSASAESEIGVSGNILLNSRHLGGLGILMKSQANDQLDIGKPTVFHGKNLEQFGASVATHSVSGSYALIFTLESSGSNVTAPITVQYIRSNDTQPTDITFKFDSNFDLVSAVGTNTTAYLHKANGIWALYIAKASSSDTCEILDLHNPWSNTDISLEWGDTSISTLPTGAVQAARTDLSVQSLTIAGHNSVVGSIVQNIPSTDLSLANNTYTSVASVTIGRGTWILIGFCRFGTNATGYRQLNITTNAGNTAEHIRVAPISGGTTQLQEVRWVYQGSESATYYMNAYQNSGSALTITRSSEFQTSLTAIRIA